MRECCSGTSACEPARSTLRLASSLLMPSSRSTHVATVPLRPIPNPQCMGHFCPLRSLSAILTTNVRKAGLSAALGAPKSGMGKFSTPQGSAWSARASAYGGDLRKAVKPPKPGAQATRRRNGLRECLRRRFLEGGHTLGTAFFVHLRGSANALMPLATSLGTRPRQLRAYGSGKVASLLSLRPHPPAPTCRTLPHHTQVR